MFLLSHATSLRNYHRSFQSGSNAMVQLPIKHSVAGFNMFMTFDHLREQLSKLYHWNAINLLIYDVAKSQHYTSSPEQAHLNQSFNFAVELPKMEKPIASYSRYFLLALKVHCCKF